MNSITIGLNLSNEVKERTVWKNYQTLRVCLFCNLLHLLATVIKFRPRQFSVKCMSEGERKEEKSSSKSLKCK